MEFHQIEALRGPNIWSRSPALEVELDLGELRDTASSAHPGFCERLGAWLPELAGRDSDFLKRAQGGIHLAQVLQHVTLELQSLAGSPVSFGLTHEKLRSNRSRVVVEYEDEELGRACLETARDLILAAVSDQPFDLTARLRGLRDLGHEVRLGPSTGAIVRAAQQQGIPVRRLNRASLVQLGHGIHQRRICTAETDRTSAIAETIAQDKQLTRSLLRAVGVPVPNGRPVADAEDAWRAAEDLEVPVVIKPQYGNHGRGVATNLVTREQVLGAYAAAREESEHILVETFVPGSDYRLLVINDKLVAASLREPAQVTGNGRSTITELVAEVNRDPRRSDGHSTVLSWIKLDAVGLAVLAEQGYTPDSVPPPGARVLIRRNGNLSTGGTATDVTDRVHPEVAARAIDAAWVVGLDIAGVDVVATDISKPLEAQRGAVVEVNAGPGLRMHLEPSAGKPRPVGEAIVAMLYPAGQTGRIPIVAVTGVNGKTTTTRLLAQLLREAGRCVGMTCTDGMYIDGRRIEKKDCSGPRSARAVLLNPRVEAAVLETARGGLLREGLGFDHCDIAVVTNIGLGDHLSRGGVETLEDLARVKRTVAQAVAPTGNAVLNAADPLVAAMAGHCPGSVIYFARDPDQPLLTAHHAGGGRTVFVRDGSIVWAQASNEEVLIALDRVPLTHGGRVSFQVENVLAVAAAAWALDLPTEVVRNGLASFTGDPRQIPGRFNVLSANGATVIVDFAHNPSALTALVEALDHFPHRRRCLVFSGCNRRDEDIIRMGEVIGNGFDQVILYADRDNENRADGEVNALLSRGIDAGDRVAQVREVENEPRALETAVADLRPGDLLVLGMEALEEALAFVQRHLERNEINVRPSSVSSRRLPELAESPRP
jgi:cyanophycin synthetase